MKSDKNHLSLPPGMRVFVDRINGRLIFKLENISGYFLGSPSTRGGNCCFHCGSATYRHKSSNDTRRGACLSCRIYECDADEKPCVIHVDLLNHYPVAKGPALEFRYNDKVAICHKISSWRYSSPRYYIQSPDFKFHFSDKGLWDAIKDARLYFPPMVFQRQSKTSSEYWIITGSLAVSN
jgi:hypothetical protein